jgi:SpoVK/Ycf46/Vps4 family AAA+-type ATPase
MLLGPPGTGKTSFAHILAKIWQALRIVDNDTFLVTRRSDWVGKYQGHSCARARKLIARAQGGVIFIDEAYSLVIDKKGDDMYGNEVIAEICEAMYNPEKNVTFIMAGYENDMKRLFDANAGLKRRFDFIYTFKKPNPEQLMEIFTQQVRFSKWKMKRGQRQDLIDFFAKNMSKLQHAGGSTEQLVRQAQQAVVARTFPVRAPHVITVQDVWEGMKTLEKINGKTVPSFIQHMYL